MNRTGYLPETLTALAGIAFAVLLLLAFSSVDPLLKATDEELIEWWSDTGNQRDGAFSMYFLLAAVPCFLVFLAGLRGRLAAAEGGAAPLASLVFAFGLCFGAVLVVGDIGRGAIAQSVRYGGEPLPGPDTLRTLTSFSALVIGLAAMPLVALTMATASMLILRTKALAAWLGWAGLTGAAVIMVFVGFLAGPWASPLLQLWIVATSFELWRTRGRTETVVHSPATGGIEARPSNAN
jgi:hypothetical protein